MLSSWYRRAVLFCTLALLAVLSLPGCGGGTEDMERTERVVERFTDSTKKVVEVVEGDSVVERRTFRITGSVQTVERGDSVARYLDIHPIDSAYVLKDYMQGTWRNTSVDTTDPGASATYVFDDDTLTFRSPAGDTIESIRVDYGESRTLYTAEGMPVTASIAGFDTVRVTGYTLVRRDTIR